MASSNGPNGTAAALRVLLVEDDPDTAATTALWLRMSGYDVQVAADGPQALQAAEADSPDVVLLDIGLPGMPGYEVARHLRDQKSKKRPVLIAITGHGQDGERLRAYESGVDLHLTKPVSPEELQQFLTRVQKVSAV